MPVPCSQGVDGEGEHADADMVTLRKRLDAWAVHWGKRWLFILEFTRPKDRDTLALQDTDTEDCAVHPTPRQNCNAPPGLYSRNSGLYHGHPGVALSAQVAG